MLGVIFFPFIILPNYHHRQHNFHQIGTNIPFNNSLNKIEGPKLEFYFELIIWLIIYTTYYLPIIYTNCICLYAKKLFKVFVVVVFNCFKSISFNIYILEFFVLFSLTLLVYFKFRKSQVSLYYLVKFYNKIIFYAKT